MVISFLESQIILNMSQFQLDVNIKEKVIEQRSQLKYFIPYARVLTKLKFRNSILTVGDNIFLRQGENQESTARITLMVKIPSINLPILRIHWYYPHDDPLIKGKDLRISTHELILSDYDDWVHIEAVKGFFKIVSEEEFSVLNPKEKSAEKLFFIRSTLIFGGNHDIEPKMKKNCLCANATNLDDDIDTCTCGSKFHTRCSGRRDKCSNCISDSK